jgi:predicted nucleic acid-binding protein
LLDVEIVQALRHLVRASSCPLSEPRRRSTTWPVSTSDVTRTPISLGPARELGDNLTAYDAIYVAVAEAPDAVGHL